MTDAGFGGTKKVSTSATLGIISFSFGIMFLATFCMINNADCVDSHVAPGDCSSKNICLKQAPEPIIYATSFIRSETFRRKSLKLSFSCSKPFGSDSICAKRYKAPISLTCMHMQRYSITFGAAASNCKCTASRRFAPKRKYRESISSGINAFTAIFLFSGIGIVKKRTYPHMVGATSIII
uniref:Uncharacterized protein n=1 Tax=Glossina pallidipes TaxID=7398 RepID=A0A1A9Z3X5_GLOPL